MKDILSEIKQIKASGKKAALCIIVYTKGSSPRKAGSKMIVFEDKTSVGTIGGGSLEYRVVDDALGVILEGKPNKFTYDLDEDLGMHCGGYAEVYIEPLIPENKLFIFGAGHVGKALSMLAVQYGFSVTMIDPRGELKKDFFDLPVTYFNDDFVESAEKIDFDQQSYIVITTPKHKFDEDVLAVCAKKTSAYIGMIGSKNKVALAKERFLNEKILSQEEIDRVNMPIGIKFNAQTPEEIALSIMAQMIDVKNSLNQ